MSTIHINLTRFKFIDGNGKNFHSCVLNSADTICVWLEMQAINLHVIYPHRNIHATVSLQLLGFFVFNTNLTFLYKIDITDGFKKCQQKIKLPPVGFELTTTPITRLKF